MTAQEAISQIRVNNCSSYCQDHDAIICAACRWGVALDALGRQIPKVPYLYGDGYADGQLVIDMYECPNCGECYELEYIEYYHCPNCGQAIDWEVG